ncbi:MAG: DUF1565 domain-containing protein [Acidobacteriota bacterium]
MTEPTSHRYRHAVGCLALVLPLIQWDTAHAGPQDFSRPWSAVHSKVLTRSTPDGNQPFAIVTTSFFADFILVLPPRIEYIDVRKFEDLKRIPIEGVVSGLAVADFDGDGTDDFAVADFAGDCVDVFFTRGDREFERSASIAVGPCPVMISAGDIDRDGRTDVSTLNFYDRTVSSARGIGDGRFAGATTSSTGIAALPVFAEDALAIIDFDTLKDAVLTVRMSDQTRQRLLKYLANAEKAYGRRNKRRTGAQLQKFIKYVKEVDDPRLRTTGRNTLILMAKQLIDQILAWRVSVDLTASPDTMAQGDSATLSWTSFNAVTATIDQGVGSVPVDGSTTVAPRTTTTYTITVTDTDGLSALDSQIVKITGAATTIYVDAENGDDATGVGSMENPYKSMTKGLSEATDGYTVSAAEGLYDVSNGEQFPLLIPSGVKLEGAGATQTVVAGAGLVAPIPCTVLMDPGSVLDSVGLYGGGLIPVSGIAPGATMGHLDVRNCRIAGYLAGVALAPLGPGTPSLELVNSTIIGGLAGVAVTNVDVEIQNSLVTSSILTGLIAQDSSMDIRGSSFQSSPVGMLLTGAGAVGPCRDSSIIDNLLEGVVCTSGAHPDFGTDASHLGGNIIRNLGAGALHNFGNDDPATLVNAVGNTWDHDPPWTDYTGTFPAGVDIVGNGPNVKWQ